MTNGTVTTDLVYVTNYCNKKIKIYTFQQKMYSRIIKECQLRRKSPISQKNANVDQLIKVEGHSFTNPNGSTKSDKNYPLESQLLSEELLWD